MYNLFSVMIDSRISVNEALGADAIIGGVVTGEAAIAGGDIIMSIDILL